MTAVRGISWKWWRLDLGWGAIGLLVTLAAYMAGIAPAINERAQRRDQTAQIEVQEAKLAELAANIHATHEALANVEKQLASDPVQLETAAQVNGRVAKIMELVGACGMTEDEIEPGAAMPALPGAEFGALPITLKGVGTFPACTAFFRRLREELPDTSVTAFELAGRSGVVGSSATAGGSSDPPVAPVVFRIGLLWYTAPMSAH